MFIRNKKVSNKDICNNLLGYCTTCYLPFPLTRNWPCFGQSGTHLIDRHIHWTFEHLINQWSHERIIMITEEELFCIGIKCDIFPLLAELYHYSWAWWIMNMKICATNENNNLFGKKLDMELSCPSFTTEVSFCLRQRF